ncbi:MAG: hypothetical protein KIH71_002900, partial [Roseobacter sp.]|nr:hypothetical protein [Roseobacter sp.]
APWIGVWRVLLIQLLNKQRFVENILEAQFGFFAHGPFHEDARLQTGDLVERLMGKKPELRFQYIPQNARFVEELDV